MSTFLRKIPAMVAAGVAVAALTTLSAGTAQAASGCWPANDGSGHYYCDNASGAGVYGDPSFGNRVGTMNSDPSWFVCRTDSGSSNGEANGPHPYRWLRTQADNGAWGYISDRDISSETDPVPSC